nr:MULTISPECIES: GNAT family N-acetyltransferase [unclassified Sphingobacterium]
MCIFSVQYTDPVIWREKDKNDALYLHRVVVNPVYKGQKQFMKVLNWAKEHALQKGLKFIRMDTWAENTKLTDYYKSYGFEVAEYYTTPNEAGIPIQYRNVEVVLFEMEL